MSNPMRERIKIAVDLIGDALRGRFASRSDMIRALGREYVERGLRPLWGFSGNPFEEELAFVYAVGKQVAAEELSKLEGLLDPELRADRALLEILSGRDARESVEASVGAASAREVLTVVRLAASYDLLERGSETLPPVVRSLSASFPELDEQLLNFKRYYVSLRLAALYSSGSVSTLPPATLAESLAAALGDERAKPDDALASRIASEIFGVPAPAPRVVPPRVGEEVPLPPAPSGAEAWRAIYDQLVSRFEAAWRADARALAEVLVREAVLKGVDPATIDVSAIDAERPLDAWRRYLKLDWRLNYVYLNVRGEFEVRLERRYDYTVLGGLSLDMARSATREGLVELLYQSMISSGSKPTDVSDEYLRMELAQLAENIIRHAQQVHAPPVRRAPTPLAARKAEVSGVPVELSLHRRRRRLYLEVRIAGALKLVIRVGQRSESTLKRSRNAVRKSLPPRLREIATLLENEIAKFLEDALSSGKQPQRSSAYNAK